MPCYTQKPIVRSQTGPFSTLARPGTTHSITWHWVLDLWLAQCFQNSYLRCGIQAGGLYRSQDSADPYLLLLLLSNSCLLLRVPAEDELREAAAAGLSFTKLSPKSDTVRIRVPMISRDLPKITKAVSEHVLAP